ncbi:MAG: IS110 family transposase [Cyclobacteriaceae bacterium]|jgi:transposase|nr:IS110 family transposase [Cyclobacteriaceae bacterium]MCK5207475.1 IS110 family transposase [Cyclobacteriaceae bacterium]MCK5279638.1 IS110 family transposase [Cyclobacteriaceae bacterium]MCK5371032.1 IS110 family transposase [Cyclobacteriaceae bacterium]
MKKRILKFSLGIDVSKDKLDCNLSHINEYQEVRTKASRRFNNTPAGIRDLIIWFKRHWKEVAPLVVVMEATGVYHENVAFSLDDNSVDIAVVLPNKSKKYMESLGYKSKNDTIDARGLAQMGAERSLPLWQRPSKSIYMLRSLCREHASLQDDLTEIRNQMHALDHAYMKDDRCYKRLEAKHKFIKKQEKINKKDIEKTIKNDKELSTKVEYITAINGVGLISVATVIGETNGFVQVEKQGQLVSYAGYDVVEKQSGKRHGKTRISKKGNSHIRRVLHFPALNVVRYGTEPFASFHQRLMDNGKLKMQAYTAVQKKLLVIMWALWRKNERFDPKHINSGLKKAIEKQKSNSDDKPLKENNTSTEIDVLHKIDSSLPEPSFFDNKINKLSIEVDEKENIKEVHCDC